MGDVATMTGVAYKLVKEWAQERKDRIANHEALAVTGAMSDEELEQRIKEQKYAVWTAIGEGKSIKEAAAKAGVAQARAREWAKERADAQAKLEAKQLGGRGIVFDPKMPIWAQPPPSSLPPWPFPAVNQDDVAKFYANEARLDMDAQERGAKLDKLLRQRQAEQEEARKPVGIGQRMIHGPITERREAAIEAMPQSQFERWMAAGAPLVEGLPQTSVVAQEMAKKLEERARTQPTPRSSITPRNYSPPPAAAPALPLPAAALALPTPRAPYVAAPSAPIQAEMESWRSGWGAPLMGVVPGMAENPMILRKGRRPKVSKEMIEGAMRATGGNKRQAARLLNMSRVGLYKALERVGMPVQWGASPTACDALRR